MKVKSKRKKISRKRSTLLHQLEQMLRKALMIRIKTKFQTWTQPACHHLTHKKQTGKYGSSSLKRSYLSVFNLSNQRRIKKILIMRLYLNLKMVKSTKRKMKPSKVRSTPSQTYSKTALLKKKFKTKMKNISRN